MKLRLTCTGTRPLLMHNERLASPLNSYARQLAELTVLRTKTEEQLWQIARLQFEGGLYFDDRLGPYVPANMLRKCLIKGARHFPAGTPGAQAARQAFRNPAGPAAIGQAMRAAISACPCLFPAADCAALNADVLRQAIEQAAALRTNGQEGR